MCSFQEKCFKVAEYVYNYLFKPRKSCACQGKCLKVGEYAYSYVFMPRKVFESCGNAYNFVFVPSKVFESCGIRLKLCVCAEKSLCKKQSTHETVCSFQEKCFKVVEYVYNYLFKPRKSCACQGKCLKVGEYAYSYVFMPRKVFESCGNAYNFVFVPSKVFESCGIRLKLCVYAEKSL